MEVVDPQSLSLSPQYDDPSASVAPMQEGRLTGEQQRKLSGPQQFNQPAAAGVNASTGGNQLLVQPQTFSPGQQQFGGPPQPQPRRSGEQPSQFIPQQMVPAHQEPVPSLPLRDRPPQAQLPVASGGGFPLQPANQPHRPNMRGGDVPWTQQFPRHLQQQHPVVQPSGR